MKWICLILCFFVSVACFAQRFTPAELAWLDRYAKGETNGINGAWVISGSVPLSALAETVVTVELDPVFALHPAFGITSTDIAAWNAYGPRIVTLESSVSTLQSDVSTLQSDVSTLQSDVSTLNTDMATWTNSYYYDVRATVDDRVDLDSGYYVAASGYNLYQSIPNLGTTNLTNFAVVVGNVQNLWNGGISAFVSGGATSTSGVWLLHASAEVLAPKGAEVSLGFRTLAGGGAYYLPYLATTVPTNFYTTIGGSMVLNVPTPGNTGVEVGFECAKGGITIRNTRFSATLIGRYR